MVKRHYNVVAGVLIHNGLILCVQRGLGQYAYTSYKYEFPGGKIEENESPVEALHRELIEELKLEIPPDLFVPVLTIHHEYPDFSIELCVFLSEIDGSSIELVEHIEHCWLSPEQLENLDWAAADWPVVNWLKRKFNL